MIKVSMNDCETFYLTIFVYLNTAIKYLTTFISLGAIKFLYISKKESKVFCLRPDERSIHNLFDSKSEWQMP